MLYIFTQFQKAVMIIVCAGCGAFVLWYVVRWLWMKLKRKPRYPKQCIELWDETEKYYHT